MSEEDKNRDTRIQQQKHAFIRNVLICLLVIVVFSVVFWAVTRNSSGTQITYNEFKTQIDGGNIKEININQGKIQIYYINGEAHWMYNRNSAESSIVAYINELYENGASNIPTVKFGTTTTINIMNILYPILMIALLIIMFVIIMKQVKGANNKSFNFVKNRARIYPSKFKFTDVAGEDEEKAELEDVVDFLKNPKKYIDLGAKIPKGVLLVGPPGTGKTLLAKAVAGEAGVPFFTISGSDFMELFVGVGASRVRDLFETAKKSKPCIIFIDEIDAVGRQRGAGMGGGNDEREQTLNQLLVQMDGFEDNEGIIVIAATNRVDILDPALLRPGRFDRRVNIGYPDIKGREEIFKVHSKNKPISKDVDVKTIARITSGFTGAEIENLLNEAAILVAKDNRNEITTEDLQKSIMKVTLGPQKKSRVIDEKDKLDTAIHESGHALISKLAKEQSPVHEVSIIPRGGAGGYTVSTDEDSTVYFREKLLCKIQMLLGGITAEKLYVGDISTGASNDLKRASNIARRMVSEWGMSSEIGMVYCGSDSELFLGRNYQERMPYSENQASVIDQEVKNIIDMCQKETEKILKANKKKLMTMANVLLEKETIYSEEIDMILKGKSKDDVIKYIESKDNSKNNKAKSESVQEEKKEEPISNESVVDNEFSDTDKTDVEKWAENNEKTAIIKEKTENIVDDLIKKAEILAQHQLDNVEKDDGKEKEDDILTLTKVNKTTVKKDNDIVSEKKTTSNKTSTSNTNKKTSNKNSSQSKSSNVKKTSESKNVGKKNSTTNKDDKKDENK